MRPLPPAPPSVPERIAGLRSQMQDQLDAVERLAEDLKAAGTALATDLAVVLECLLADRLGPALQDLAALEEAARPGGASR